MEDFELTVKQYFQKKGFEVFKNGWPDFICIKEEKNYDSVHRQIMGIEVKTGSGKLSPEQKIMHKILKQAGVPIYIVRPETLKQISQNQHARTVFSGEHLRKIENELFYYKTKAQNFINKIKEIEKSIENISIVFDKE